MNVEAAPAPQADTRNRIVEAAEHLFRDVGYHKTTVADIAKELRMSPANVYRFFDSKRAINEAVAERCTGRMGAAAEDILAGPGSAADRLRGILTMVHRSVVELGTADAKMRDMVEVAMTESWGVIRAHLDHMERVFVRLVQDGVESGEFDADPEVAGPCIRAAMIRFSHPALIAQCAEMNRPSLEQMVDFVLAALRYRPALASAP